MLTYILIIYEKKCLSVYTCASKSYKRLGKTYQPY